MPVTEAVSPAQAPTAKLFPELEAEEVQRRFQGFRQELKPAGTLSLTLVLRAATMAVRMERCVHHETARLTRRVRQALADFVPPEGVDAAEAEKLREEEARLAAFDPSDEAALSRKYEAAAERSFHSALKELRLLESARKAREDERDEEPLGSFSPETMTDEELDAMERELARPAPRPGPIPASDRPSRGARGVSPAPIEAKRRR